VKHTPLFLTALSLGAACIAHGQSRLTNLSVRSTAGSGAETLIVGFAIGGSGSKPILLRGVGPSLAPFGVSDAVSDPRLQLFRGTTSLAQNDNWGGGSTLDDAFQATGAFRLPTASRDAALLETLSPGSYSVHLTSDAGRGIALVECYDANTSSKQTYLTNLSARSVAGTGSSVLTVGFSISGSEPKPILIRGIGPTLTSFGVTNPITTPRLILFDNAGDEIADNSGWASGVTPDSLFISAGAFSLPPASRDAVLFFALPPGNYTAQVSSLAGTSGPALIEAYEVNASPVSYVVMEPIVQATPKAPDDPGVGTPSPGPDALPRVTFQGRPTYPFELRRASITGTVIVDFYVKTDGRVANAVATRATDVRFATAAVNAVSTWLFIPGRREGKLVATHMQVPIIFTLTQ
jgi:TonB family protein